MSADTLAAHVTRMFIESFFAQPRMPATDKLVEWVRENPDDAAREIRKLRHENMRLAVDSAELSWVRNPDRMGT